MSEKLHINHGYSPETKPTLCGCRINISANMVPITYCPLHGAASELLAALEWCANHLNQIAAEQYPDITDAMRKFNSARNAEQTIQKAKGLS